MLLSPAGTTTITVRRSLGSDAHGDSLGATQHDIPNCAFGPTRSDERDDMRETVIGEGTLYAPYDADLLPTDQVLMPDYPEYDPVTGVPGLPLVWEVIGEIRRWTSAHTGHNVGIQAELRVWHG